MIVINYAIYEAFNNELLIQYSKSNQMGQIKISMTFSEMATSLVSVTSRSDAGSVCVTILC